MPTRALGTRFDDRFKVLRLLGQGAMGHVYEVLDEELNGVRWALKELDLGVVLESERDEAVELFQREVRILSSLTHPGCPRVIHQFQTDKGAPAFVMTLVDGTPLDLLLEEIGRALSVHEALPILLQLCHILEHLHAQNPPVIFRDLKPSNLMLTEHGQLALIDFGIARLYDPQKKKDTQELGTPGFCSPEQYGRGQTTIKSDIYALATTAYFLLTRADVQSFAFQFPSLQEQLPEEKLSDLSELVDQMLSLKPDDRPGPVSAVRQELHALFQSLDHERERSTSILRPSLRALTEQSSRPDDLLRVFDASFFKCWFRVFF